jgi:hypothetical protein
MPDTFVKIATVTVGSGGASTIDFTSIPSTYTDLCLKLSLRANNSLISDSILLSFNGSTTSFTMRYLEGTGSSATSGTSPARYIGIANGNTSTASTFGNTEIYIPNYAGNSNKSVSSDAVTETNATTIYADFVASLWSNTAAINQVTISPNGATLFLQYSTATLYGISKT